MLDLHMKRDFTQSANMPSIAEQVNVLPHLGEHAQARP